MDRYTRRARSCSESVEDLGKTVAGINNNSYYRAEARRDYQALREKFGAEFHRKLIEWERLKSTRNARDGLPLSEERLAPEFRKKLQDWKRAKKGRRSNNIEQQHVNRRRLTDWQLWRSSSKPEPRCYGKNQNSIGSRGSCASIGSAGSGSDGRQHLCEDFVKRMEAWRRMSEVACRGSEMPRSPINRVASDIIDETEFLSLEKLLLLFGQKTKKERRESDAKQLNDCFDGDSRFTAASRGVNCGNEVLIRTSVGSYRFEGISREFTRKLYDWEKYRGISPRSSTFRLLGPGYTPFAQDSDDAALVEPSSATGKSRALHWTLKRSKSDGSVFEGSVRDESFTLRRSTSLQSLSSTDKLEDDARMDTLPASNDSQGIKDPSEDTAVEDSEPEAMIVDIEDVIEETASPLTGVQPHQTPVYSVAASETTSIAVPLGTVTSSHEPSPVFLVDAEEDDDCGRWNGKKWIGPEARSSENSPSPEHFPISEDWHGGTTSLDTEDKPNWNAWCKEDSKEDENSTGWTEKVHRSILDDDSVKSERSIGWNRDTWDESSDEANRGSLRLELPLTPIYESKTDMTKQDLFVSFIIAQLKLASCRYNQDSTRTCKEMTETRKIEDPADKSNNEQTSNNEDLQDEENNEKAERKKIILSTDHCTYQLARTLSSSNCDSKEDSLKLSNLNLDDNKDLSDYGGVDTENEASAHYESCSSPETDADRHYEVLRFKTDMRDTTDNRLYEPINCYENLTSSLDDRSNSVKGHFSLSKLSGTKKPNFLDTSTNLLTDSTIRTVPITVSRNNDARSLERILINEETLNKIIVPTASTEGEKDMEKRRDCVMNIDRMDEIAAIDDHPTRTAQAECVRKDSSASRNVFVKTKRMIFGPFRRSEDRSAPRKESDGSVDSRLSRSSKSKSKSRSASPKLCRQDALLRMSLSLPWPLRSTTKESEIPSEAGSRRNSKASKNARSTGINFVGLPEQLGQSRTTSIERDQNARRIRDEVNREQTQGEHGKAKQDQSRFDEQQNEGNHCQDGGKQEETKGYREQNEAKQQDRNNAKCDAVPSDLMHKLRILSDAAARREGRVISAESSASSSFESRSSRIRRAKESFLSRRGGPFCLTMEPEAPNYGDPWRRRPTSQVPTAETTKSNEATVITSNYEEEGAAGNSAEVMQDEVAYSSENKVDACQEKDLAALDVGIRSESLVKSASAGMINVDPDTFGRLVDRGCESLPRTIAKRRDSASPLAKIVSKLKLSRLIRARNADNSGNMSTISTLCRQSLLIDMRCNIEDRLDDGQEGGNHPVEAARDQNEDDDDHPDEDLKH
ncbi:hypothetical protein X777_01830 [Ooceraea biroi]|uniref:Uncharacterized protein n=1 Tax=Ooceraea biroi TaxID=2015173 RepID=A0A026WQ42_OOCBI|nr:hypothetical protein X777_01830 [Ooceraea biroi]